MASYLDTDTEIVAQVQLFKAFLQHKNFLNQEIGLMKVKLSYFQSNQDFKIMRELQAVVKLLGKKLNELRTINVFIKKHPISSFKKGNFEEFVQILTGTEKNLDVPREIFSLNFAKETQNEEYKEKLEALAEEYDQKVDLYRHSEQVLEQNSALSNLLNDLETEVFNLQDEIHKLNAGKSKIEEKHEKKRIFRKSSFEKIKIYDKLSDEALQLRSKLLLQQEMMKSLEIAGEELKKMQNKISLDEENVKYLKQESLRRAKSLAQDEEELRELKKKSHKLEMRIQGLRDEKEDLVKVLVGGFEINEEFVEDDTLQPVSIYSGFEKMKKEKDLLLEESEKLKERISKLGGLGRINLS